MATNFETELNALLDRNDEKKKKHVEVQKIAHDEAAEFLEQFKITAEQVIKPILEEIKSQLASRGRESRVEDNLTGVNDEGKEQNASIAIYFNISKDKYVSRLHEYPHVSFNCDKRGKVLQVYESTIGPNHGGHAGPSGSLTINEVTESAVKSRILNVLKDIPL